MEHEYKWQITPSKYQEVLNYLEISGDNSEEITMLSKYYDTENSDLKNIGAGLRLRQENENSVCCLKVNVSSDKNGATSREEFEVLAADIEDGISKLLDIHKVSLTVPELSCKKVVFLCSIEFKRLNNMVKTPKFCMQMSFDSGTFIKGDKTSDFTELECEYVEGCFDSYIEFCAKMTNFLSLKPEHLSKLARCMNL